LPWRKKKLRPCRPLRTKSKKPRRKLWRKMPQRKLPRRKLRLRSKLLRRKQQQMKASVLLSNQMMTLVNAQALKSMKALKSR
jgi:hypothetical protein